MRTEAFQGDFPKILNVTPDWVAVSKPSGWLTIAGRGAGENAPVLSSWLEKERQEKIWVIHRIDRETSGLVLFARSAEAHRGAGIWFQSHQVKKAYDCLAHGRPAMPLMRIRETIEGAPCTTQLEVKETFDGCFLARAFPVTGRRHQIRIHLSDQGYPLLGDIRYGGKRNIACGGVALVIGRTALHASRLEFPSREVFEAPWPEDFRSWVESLRGGAKSR